MSRSKHNRKGKKRRSISTFQDRRKSIEDNSRRLSSDDDGNIVVIETKQTELTVGLKNARYLRQSEWQGNRLSEIEIYYEPEINLEPDAHELYVKSFEALSRKKADLAEVLLSRALEIVPDSPQLRNNLAMAYMLQGRHEESEMLVMKIMAEHPDYLFARCNFVHRIIESQKYEESAELLKPILQMDRMHASEAAAVCNAYIHLSIRLGEIDDAAWWIDTLEDLYPTDPNLDQWRKLVRE